MPQLMLVNPAKRRKARKTRRVAAKRGRRTRARKHNPVTASSVRHRTRRHLTHHARKSNPHRRIRRRRNPISLGSLRSGNIMKMLKVAVIGGAGSIAMDAVMTQVNKFLPASLQPSTTGPGINDILRVALSIVLGRGLAKVTKGVSETAAAGALTVQAAKLMHPFISGMMPNVVPAVAGLGYIVPQRVIPGSPRISPMARGNFGAYSNGNSPLLSMYERDGSASPLLSGIRVGARVRDMQVR